MTASLFADTFYFLALLSPTDAAHEQAVAIGDSDVRIVTTEWVLTEVADGLATKGHRRVFMALLRTLRTDSQCRIIRFNAADFDAALDLYEKRHDRRWSLSDCTSFVVMKRLGLREALTADRHFEQAGFKAVFT